MFNYTSNYRNLNLNVLLMSKISNAFVSVFNIMFYVSK